jgi:hypothetical protein
LADFYQYLSAVKDAQSDCIVGLLKLWLIRGIVFIIGSLETNKNPALIEWFNLIRHFRMQQWSF